MQKTNILNSQFNYTFPKKTKIRSHVVCGTVTPFDYLISFQGSNFKGRFNHSTYILHPNLQYSYMPGHNPGSLNALVVSKFIASNQHLETYNPTCYHCDIFPRGLLYYMTTYFLTLIKRV